LIGFLAELTDPRGALLLVAAVAGGLSPQERLA